MSEIYPFGKFCSVSQKKINSAKVFSPDEITGIILSISAESLVFERFALILNIHYQHNLLTNQKTKHFEMA
jgi:hypothetical protein